MNSFWSYLVARLPDLGTKIVEQIALSLGSMLIAILISVPLGIWIARKDRLRNVVLGFNSILQTLPSLAVLGFLLPLLGIGIKTAIVTLVIYAMLPLLRNTVTGLLGIAPYLLEAADGLGFTKWQRLWRIELPLAAPVIVAGIRTAMAMTVGIATLASFIGAGGLGDFIYEGLSLNNTNLILLGAIPVALLALMFDFIIGRFEKKLTLRTKHQSSKLSRWWLWWLSLVLLGIFLLGLMLQSFRVNQSNQIRIGTKNFSEQLVLGEIIAQLLEAKTSLQVVRRFNLGGTMVCHHALLDREIDLYPEYTGTAYAVILNQSTLTNPQQVFDYVKAAYQKKFKVVWLQPFGFNNANAVALSQAVAALHHITTLSDLVTFAPSLTIGVPSDFMERPDGFVGLKRKYDLRFKRVRLMDPGLMYKAVQQNQIEAIMAFATDGRISAYKLQILVDDRHLFPPYYAAPIVRGELLLAHPEILPVLNMLTGKIDNKTMQRLNYQVDILKRPPASVAKEFLLSLLQPVR